MTAQQAYIEGFIKRAGEHGYNQEEALCILKQASPETFGIIKEATRWRDELLAGNIKKNQPLAIASKMIDPYGDWPGHHYGNRRGVSFSIPDHLNMLATSNISPKDVSRGTHAFPEIKELNKVEKEKNRLSNMLHELDRTPYPHSTIPMIREGRKKRTDSLKGRMSDLENTADYLRGRTDVNALNKHEDFMKAVRSGLSAQSDPSPRMRLIAQKIEIQKRLKAQAAYEAQQAAYRAAAGTKEVIHPPTKILNKLRMFFKRK